MKSVIALLVFSLNSNQNYYKIIIMNVLGGQTLTKSVEFEEGTIQTNTESHSHSIESGLEGRL